MSSDKHHKDSKQPADPLTKAQELFVKGAIADQQFAEIAEISTTYKIEIIPLKGIWSRHNLYEDPYERTLSDIDILVKPENYRRTGEMLEELGYAPDLSFGSRVDFGSAIEIAYFREGGLPVEIHKQIATGLSAKRFSSLLFEKSSNENKNLERKSILIPPLEYNFVLAVFHFRDHGMRIADYQLEDTKRMLDDENIDKSKILQLCANYQILLAFLCLLSQLGEKYEAMFDCSAGIDKRLKKRIIMELNNSPVLTRDGEIRMDKYSKFARKSYRLFLHLYLGRDSFFESFSSQVLHVGQTLKAASEYVADIKKSK